MSKRDSQRERWARHGLISRRQDHPKGHEGSVTVEGADTPAREVIIQAELDRHHTYQQIANELILQSFDLYKATPVRRFLVAYCDLLRVLQDPGMFQSRERHALPEDAPARSASAERARIRRSITRLGDTIALDGKQAFDGPTRDVLYAQIAGMAGILPLSMHGGLLDGSDFPTPGVYQAAQAMLADPAQVTDLRIMQGLADGRERAAQIAPYLGAEILASTGIPLEEQARIQLSWHRCTYEHTLAQALIPQFALIAIFSPEELVNLPASQADVRDLIERVNIAVIGPFPDNRQYKLLDELTKLINRVHEVEAHTGAMGS